MWCIATLNQEYRQRMYHLLELYAQPLRRDEPIVCVDEKSLQLLHHSRTPMPMKPGSIRKEDYEYVRRGTCNLFVAVQPKAGVRTVVITDHRAKTDFVAFVRHLLATTYRGVRCLHLVLDNLNTHFAASFVDVLGERRAAKLLRRVQFHYTPKHASWLNMAEIEIGVMARQCLSTRFENRDMLEQHVEDWEQRRNRQRRTIEWTFTKLDADVKLGRHYVS